MNKRIRKYNHFFFKDKTLIACLFFCLLVSFSGCDFIYRLIDKEGAEEKDLVGDAMPYEANPTIKEIQLLLDLYGYDPGKADGIWGGQTRLSIKRFQKDQGLKETGFVDKETWAKMCIFRPYGLVEGTELNIELVQFVLKELEYDVGRVDGKLGPKTIEAVKQFQKDQGLKVDGKIGYNTLAALASHLVIENK